MCDAELVVNNAPRIHAKIEDLTEKSQYIVVKDTTNETTLKILLELDGIFSFFNTRKLSE